MTQLDSSESFALKLDADDPLKSYRSRFIIPQSTIYLDGNSLGLVSHDAERKLLQTLKEWKDLAIRGWLDAEQPWFTLAEKLGEMAAPLVGAKPEEVVATGTTTVNIHSLISSFYDPQNKRTKILADSLNFPSDIYALQGQLSLRGFNPNDHLILVPSEDKLTLNTGTIISMMTDDVALIFLPSVIYRSGQLLDMATLTREAHARSIPIGFDCSHSVGAVPHHLHDWGVDFALWCGYKYLNGGPGCTAFLYLHDKHFNKEPCLKGWFGYVKGKQFDMLLDFENEKNAGGWQISSPGILGSTTLHGSLDIFHEAGIENIREKSLKMTSYLIDLIDEVLSDPPYSFSIGTPREPDSRGGHVALERENEAWRICEAMKARGIIPDFRPPHAIRLAPIALYNTYHEIWQTVKIIKEIIDNKEYENFSIDRKIIS